MNRKNEYNSIYGEENILFETYSQQMICYNMKCTIFWISAASTLKSICKKLQEKLTLYRGKRIREDDADMRTSKRNAGNRETTTRMKNAEWDEKEDREGNKKSNQK